MNTASTWRRVLAYGIDSIIMGLCFLPFWMQVWGSMLLDHEVSVGWQWLGVVLLLQLFYKWLFLYFLGGTLGKLFLGLRVVSRTGDENLGLMQSFLRVLADGLSLFFGLAPRALALLRLDRTHVSDWVAETRVVQLAPQTMLMRRHWAVALIVVWISFFSQFSRVYQSLQSVDFEDGRIFLDLDSLQG
jgi:uncharacterized RDD family membrane protein YckC